MDLELKILLVLNSSDLLFDYLHLLYVSILTRTLTTAVHVSSSHLPIFLNLRVSQLWDRPYAFQHKMDCILNKFRLVRPSLLINIRSVSETLPYSTITNLGSKPADCPILIHYYYWVRQLTEFLIVSFQTMSSSMRL